MSLDEFRNRVRDLRRPTGMPQEALARAIGLHPTALSHKLNGTGEARLTNPEVKAIVLALAEWDGLATQAQAVELLEIAGLKRSTFSAAEWQASPLGKLEAGPTNSTGHEADDPGQAASEWAAKPHNLPAPATILMGREREVHTVSDLLCRDDVRLLTLTGPGGTGKTRLGVAVGRALLGTFRDGVFFVPLASLSDPSLVTAAIAGALDIKEVAGGLSLQSTLKDTLRDKELLLVLDNFEQVVDAAHYVGELLASGPGVKMLVTSRALLHLYGEHEFVVPTLSTPSPGAQLPPEALLEYPSVAVFVQRARAATSAFVPDSKNMAAIGEICHRLDGLPLAIELAAARSKLLSPTAILDRLGRRLDLLLGGARDLDPRHQTMRNTIKWSYDLLDEGEQKLFVQLGVFAGGCTMEAAGALVAGDDGADLLERISSLVDKSMVLQEGQSNGMPRFYMLETIREYALDQLASSGQREILYLRHAAYYAGLAQAANNQIRGPLQAAVMLQLEQEHDNLRVALNYACDMRLTTLALDLAAALWFFWYSHGHLSEGRHWLSAVLSFVDGAEGNQVKPAASSISDPPAPTLLASVMNAAGLLAGQQGDFKQAVYWTGRGLELRRQIGDKQGVANALNNLGEMARHQGEDYGMAARLLEESLGMQRELGNKRGIASTLGNMASLAHDQGDYEKAAALIAETVELMRELQHWGGLANALDVMGNVERLRGNLQSAQDLLDEGMSYCLELGDKASIAVTTGHLGQLALDQGNISLAARLLERSLLMHRELGDLRNVASNLQALEELALAQDDVRRGAQLAGAVNSLRLSVGIALPFSEEAGHKRNLSILRAQLGVEALDAAFALGQDMSLEQAIAYALGETESA